MNLRGKPYRQTPFDLLGCQPRKMKAIKDVLIFRSRDAVADPITVCFPWDTHGKYVASVGMGDAPFHPQGFCQHGEALIGPHLGERINYVDLNDDCAKVIRLELAAYNGDAPDFNHDGD